MTNHYVTSYLYNHCALFPPVMHSFVLYYLLFIFICFLPFSLRSTDQELFVPPANFCGNLVKCSFTVWHLLFFSFILFFFFSFINFCSLLPSPLPLWIKMKQKTDNHALLTQRGWLLQRRVTGWRTEITGKNRRRIQSCASARRSTGLRCVAISNQIKTKQNKTQTIEKTKE